MRKRAAIFIVLIVTVLLGESALACSVCQCGDNLFCPLQKESKQDQPNLPLLVQPHEFRLNLQTTYLSKSNALAPDEGIGSESQKEFQPKLRLSYGITDQLSVAAELPMSFKSNRASDQEGSSRQHTAGLGDMQMSAVWTEPFGYASDHAFAAGLAFALKVPTGNNNIKRDGERLDEHLQAGTGSYDWQTGLSVSRTSSTTTIFTSFYYKRMGTNSHEYHYGNAALYNLGLLYNVSKRITLSAQLNGRSARSDREAGDPVENTGGAVTYFSPGVRLPVVPSMNFLLNVQIPIYQNLYGDQTERTVVNGGVSLAIL
jgi:hypothetical protein